MVNKSYGLISGMQNESDYISILKDEYLKIKDELLFKTNELNNFSKRYISMKKNCKYQKDDIFNLNHDISILKIENDKNLEIIKNLNNKLHYFNFHSEKEENFYQNSLIHSTDEDYNKCKEVLKELNNFVKLEEKRI